jgi:hypothetical protein
MAKPLLYSHLDVLECRPVGLRKAQFPSLLENSAGGLTSLTRPTRLSRESYLYLAGLASGPILRREGSNESVGRVKTTYPASPSGRKTGASAVTTGVSRRSASLTTVAVTSEGPPGADSRAAPAVMVSPTRNDRRVVGGPGMGGRIETEPAVGVSEAEEDVSASSERRTPPRMGGTSTSTKTEPARLAFVAWAATRRLCRPGARSIVVNHRTPASAIRSRCAAESGGRVNSVANDSLHAPVNRPSSRRVPDVR